MNKKISFFNRNSFIFSIIVFLIFLYDNFFMKKHLNLIFFFIFLLQVGFSFFNAVYVYNIKISLLDKMNIKRKKIYTKLYLYGLLSYLPILFVVVSYSIWGLEKIALVGIISITYNLINIILVNTKININYYITSFLFAFIGSALIYIMSF